MLATTAEDTGTNPLDITVLTKVYSYFFDRIVHVALYISEPKALVLKGIVQRKLRWVESNVTRWVESVLGRWTLFFNFKGTPSRIWHKTFSPLEHKLLVMLEIIGEALKMVCSANQFAETWY